MKDAHAENFFVFLYWIQTRFLLVRQFSFFSGFYSDCIFLPCLEKFVVWDVVVVSKEIKNRGNVTQEQFLFLLLQKRENFLRLWKLLSQLPFVSFDFHRGQGTGKKTFFDKHSMLRVTITATKLWRKRSWKTIKRRKSSFLFIFSPPLQ